MRKRIARYTAGIVIVTFPVWAQLVVGSWWAVLLVAGLGLAGYAVLAAADAPVDPDPYTRLDLLDGAPRGPRPVTDADALARAITAGGHHRPEGNES